MTQKITPFQALTAAVEAANSQSALARICGVSQTAVWKWLQSGKRMPAEYVLKAEAGTGISRHLLRPDIYPSVEPSPPCDDTYNEDCGPALPRPRSLVAGNPQPSFPRKDVA